jgi:hypothetical protein
MDDDKEKSAIEKMIDKVNDGLRTSPTPLRPPP